MLTDHYCGVRWMDWPQFFFSALVLMYLWVVNTFFFFFWLWPALTAVVYSCSWSGAHTLDFLQGRHLEVECRSSTNSVLLCNAELFSRMVVPIHTPTFSAWEFLFSYITANNGYSQNLTLSLTYILGPFLSHSSVYFAFSLPPPQPSRFHPGLVSTKWPAKVSPSWLDPLTLCILRPNIAISFKWVNIATFTKTEVARNS